MNYTCFLTNDEGDLWQYDVTAMSTEEAARKAMEDYGPAYGETVNVKVVFSDNIAEFNLDFLVKETETVLEKV